MKPVNLDELPPENTLRNTNVRKRVMIPYGELGNVMTFAQAVFPPGEMVDTHKHEEIDEIFYVESGVGVITIEGTDHVLVPGTCAVARAREGHAIRNTGETELVLTYLMIKSAPCVK